METPHPHHLLRDIATKLHGASGSDGFGKQAEQFARFFGTPKFLLGQTLIVTVWLIINAMGASTTWDPYPFILLNLMFSLQAAYAPPLILLAQTRQADRNKALADADNAHREALANAAADRHAISQQQLEALKSVLELNTQLTEKVEALTAEIHGRVVKGWPVSRRTHPFGG